MTCRHTHYLVNATSLYIRINNIKRTIHIERAVEEVPQLANRYLEVCPPEKRRKLYFISLIIISRSQCTLNSPNSICHFSLFPEIKLPTQLTTDYRPAGSDNRSRELLEHEFMYRYYRPTTVMVNRVCESSSILNLRSI